jgi:glycosyltransferase 2 family protein
MSSHSPIRRALGVLLKATISALLLYLSLRTVDVHNVGSRLGSAHLGWLAVIVLCLIAQVPMLAARWRDIAIVCGAKLTLADALRYLWIGLFFGQVLPSTAGGDAVRIWLMARRGEGWSKAIYSVLIDRVVGVSAMAAILVLCLPWTLQLIHDPAARLALVLIGFGAIAGIVVFLACGAPLLRIIERWRLGRHLATASRMAAQLYRSAAGTRVAALAIASHLITVAAMWAGAVAVGGSVTFTEVLLLVFPVLLVATLPISIAGWGIRESAMVLAFAYAGLPQSDGLMVSILFGLANLAVGAIGGLVWITMQSRARATEAETLEPPGTFAPMTGRLD